MGTITLDLNGHKIWQYSARDRHGSSCWIAMVNQVTQQSEQDFYEAIQDAAGAGALVLRSCLYSHFMRGKPMPYEYDKLVEFSLNGRQFSSKIHSDRKIGKNAAEHFVDGVALSHQEFKKEVFSTIGEARYVIFNALERLHPSYKNSPIRPQPSAEDTELGR